MRSPSPSATASHHVQEHLVQHAGNTVGILAVLGALCWMVFLAHRTWNWVVGWGRKRERKRERHQ